MKEGKIEVKSKSKASVKVVLKRMSKKVVCKCCRRKKRKKRKENGEGKRKYLVGDCMKSE